MLLLMYSYENQQGIVGGAARTDTRLPGVSISRWSHNAVEICRYDHYDLGLHICSLSLLKTISVILSGSYRFCPHIVYCAAYIDVTAILSHSVC